MYLSDKIKQAIDEQVKIDMMLGVITKQKGNPLPRIHYDYIVKRIGSMYELKVFDSIYSYVRDLIWEDEYEPD